MAKRGKSSTSLVLRLDEESKAYLVRAAKLRRMSVGEFVRLVAIPQARKEVQAARDNVISMTREEQLAFWNALNEPLKLSAAQQRLGAIMRGVL